MKKVNSGQGTDRPFELYWEPLGADGIRRIVAMGLWGGRGLWKGHLRLFLLHSVVFNGGAGDGLALACPLNPRTAARPERRQLIGLGFKRLDHYRDLRTKWSNIIKQSELNAHLAKIRKTKFIEGSDSWEVGGGYNRGSLSKELRKIMEKYRLK